MKSTSVKKFKVDFTYINKASTREIYLTRTMSGENIEEIAIKLEAIYNKVKILTYSECLP